MSKFSNSLLALALAAAAGAQPPAITPPGIFNSASRMPAALAGGKLAPGAKIVISGIRLIDPGSATLVHLQHGDWSASVRPLSIHDTELEVRLPPDTPTGGLDITVTNGQGSSRAHRMEVASSTPGIVTLNGEGWGPAVTAPVRPGQSVTLQVNGLNHAQAKVFVGGKPSHHVSSGQDTLTFTVPNDAPRGCWTPIWIQSASGALSNFATVPIATDRQNCEQIQGWPLRPLHPDTRDGVVLLARVQGSFEFPRGSVQPFHFDGAAGLFFQAAAGSIRPPQALPPSGTCTTYTSPFALVFENFVSVRRMLGQFRSVLNAGPSLSIVRGDQKKLLSTGKTPGPYFGLLGGAVPLTQTSPQDLFLRPGPYSIRSTAASDIGPLDLNLNIPPPFQWLDESSLANVDRSAGIPLHWTNLGRGRQLIFMALSVDQDAAAMGTCVCVAPRNADHMTIPPYAFANFPATQPNETLPFRFVLLASIPAGPQRQAQPKGLDDVRAAFLDLHGKSVTFH